MADADIGMAVTLMVVFGVERHCEASVVAWIVPSKCKAKNFPMYATTVDWRLISCLCDLCSLSKEAQACLAGNTQRVAKLLTVKADYEVIRELSRLDNPEQSGHDWDDR